MTDDEVQSSVVRWIASVTGVTVIKAFQGIDRPPLPYVMVEFGTVEELSDNPEQFRYEELSTTNSEGEREVSVTPLLELEWLFLVYSFGEGQSSALRRIKQGVHIAQVQEPLTPLTIHDTGVINSVPEFIDQHWEPRSQLNVMVRGVTTGGFVIDTIEEHTPLDIT